MERELFNHQKKIIDDDPKCTGIWYGTGSGKTRLLLLLARGKTLVVAPKMQVQDKNWEREKEKIGLNLDLTVISKETFRRDWAKLPKYDTFIGDEAHHLFGATTDLKTVNKVQVPKHSQIFEATLGYKIKHKPTRFYLATATPDRSPMAIWAAGMLLGKDWNWWRWRGHFYFSARMGFRTIWMKKKDEETEDYLASLVRKLGYVGRLDDWMDVPDQIYKVDKFDLTAEQKKAIKEVSLDYPDPLVRLGKIDQVENGVIPGDKYNEVKRLPCPKNEKILDYAHEFGKVLVFARYTEQIHYIRDVLEKGGKRVLILDGKTKDKGKIMEEAKDGEDCVVIAQCSISAGYELPEYPCVIFASLSGKLEDLVQGKGRVQRVNAIKKNVYVHLVMKGGVDMARYSSNANKEDFHEKIYITKNL